MKILQEIQSLILGKKDYSRKLEFNKANYLKELQNLSVLLQQIENETPFLVFRSKEEIRQWAQEYYNNWEQSLTLSELNHIKLYTSASFKYNQHLRQNKYHSYKYRIQHLDSAIEKSSSPSNIISFRWLDRQGFQCIIGSSVLRPGIMFLEKGFSSTTLLFNGNSEYGADVLLILKIPTRFKGACLKNISNIKSEDEFLLKRNTIYTVEKIIYLTDTHLILLCNVQ
ncbi:hypothetical protein Desor_0765 [Desulfosporosinus orientis DSM 765]|uniref:ADP ribosyltransferase domain-containing protein n=1 Tax=Desulfosporosinus orientis (strain ATCC 19365 / DSM 765 / NCIMB 8382 / VKM B-1628 / Singapore I) TaxID=768706 RepID=G7W822_DESOD|nr:ADP-ribosyltransferase [Desulfosporosinus orientis]AET66448.1 hypothetical protein Desor_0765 [Desulfosporosinus orientis DSM 765]